MYKRSHFFILFSILSLLLFSTNSLCQNSTEREWPSEISETASRTLFSSIQETLKESIQEKKSITIGITNGKLIYGTVQNYNDKECNIKDPRGNVTTVSYRQIRARYLTKLIPSKYQDGDMLLTLGILFYYEKEIDRANSYFQQAVALGQSDAEAWQNKTAQNQPSKPQNQTTKPTQEPTTLEDFSSDEVTMKPAIPNQCNPPAKTTNPPAKTNNPPANPPAVASATKPPTPPSTTTKTPTKPTKTANIGRAVKIASIKTTRKVNLQEQAIPGAYTLFFFYTNS